jgi:hypothetical protein
MILLQDVFDDPFVGDCIAHASVGHKQRLTCFLNNLAHIIRDDS